MKSFLTFALVGFALNFVLFAGQGNAVTEVEKEIQILTAVIPPYTYEENGKANGLIVEIVREMAKRVGHSGEISFLPWNRALNTVLTAKNDTPVMIIPLNRSPEREKKFKWIQEMFVDETVIVTKKDDGPAILKIEKARDYRIGVLMGSPLEAQLRIMKFAKIEPALTEEINAKKLHFDRLRAWHVARLVAPFVYEREGFSSAELQYGGNLDANDLYLGGSLGVPEKEIKKWRAAFKEISSSGLLKKIIKKYM